MKETILITNSFPYLKGEQFLETEVSYYQNYKDVKFRILPSHNGEQKRKINGSIEIDNYLIENMDKIKVHELFYLLVKSIFSKVFYKEFFLNHLFNVNKIKSFIRSMVKYQLYYDVFDTYFKNKDNLDSTVVYTYWNTETTYALQSLKNKYRYKLVSRIHGADIYQERSVSNYMPLKKQFTQNIDKLYTITESANDYLHRVYRFDYKVLELSRLGVKDYNIVSMPSEGNVLSIVSCSSLIEIKQVDKIIKALSSLARETPDVTYSWSHIGDGELYGQLVQLANEMLGSVENINFEFKGNMENREVFKFYKNNTIDLFINVSLSEGVPVSIMEAMSCHIPIVAPDIGGISDMVIDGENGYLLSSVCETGEIVDALKDGMFYKNEEIRNNSYRLFLEKYDAKKNYLYFLDSIVK